jgi:hypothetical protein
MKTRFPGNWSLHMRSGELQLCFNAETPLHYDNFTQFAELLVASLAVKVIQQDMGADAYCWVFHYQDANLLLNYQEMSQSCWICTTRDADEVALLALANQLAE